MEMLLETRALPDSIIRLIQTKRVKLREAEGEFVITPIHEKNTSCPLFGMFADGKISSEKFMARKQAEKELEV